MNVHLYATDESVFSLFQALPEKEKVSVTAIIVPQNRINTKKVNRIMKRVTDIPIYIQTKRDWSLDGIPDADIAISWLYSQFISSNILDSYTYGILNMHGGKIPQYRGANVLQWAIINGESDLGVTWHTMVREIDAGPVWVESSVPISPDVDALYIRKLLIEEGVRTFPQAWNACIDSEKKGIIPDLSKGKYWPTRKPEDGRIKSGMTIRQVKDMIRALPKPWPGPTIKVGKFWRQISAVSTVPIGNSVPYKASGGGVIYLLLCN